MSLDYHLQPHGSPHTVRIKTADGIKRVSALVYGQLAIHRWGDAWHITYLGSGRTIIIAQVSQKTPPCVLIEAARELWELFDDVPGLGQDETDAAYRKWAERVGMLITPWKQYIETELKGK